MVFLGLIAVVTHLAREKMEHKDKVGYKILKDKLPLIRDSALDPQTLADELNGRGIIGHDTYDYAINPLHEIRERRRKLVGGL